MQRSASPLLLAALLASACEQEPPIVSNGAPIDGPGVALAVHGDDGRAVVRAVNTFGVASVGIDGDFQMDGGVESVPLDSLGYGTMVVEPGSHQLTAVQGDTELHGFDKEWSGLGISHAVRPPGAAKELARATGGAMAAVGRDVWWVGPALPAHTVVSLPDADVDGVRSVHLDGDGVYDGIVWGGDTVLLLRGRAGGGMGFGFGVQAPGWTAEGAAVADMDADGYADLIMAWTGPDGHFVQIWTGNGAWTFHPSHERTIQHRPLDVTVGADRGDGEVIATVLVAAEGWERFVATAPGQYLITGPPLGVGFGDGATLWADGDINQDGSPEVVVMAPRVEMGEREVYIWDLTDGAVNFLRSASIGSHLAFGDANKDGFAQMWILDQEEGMLQHLGWSGQQYLYQTSTLMPEVAPLGLGDVDDDGVLDLLVAGQLWSWWRGWLDDEAGGRWRGTRIAASGTDAKLSGPIAYMDLDGNPATDELVGVVSGGGARAITVWNVHGAAPAEAASVIVGTLGNEAIVDLAVCGTDVWVLAASRVLRVDMAGRRLVGIAPVSGPSAVACGDGPGGVKAVVVGEDGRVEFSDSVQVLSQGAGSPRGVAIADRGAGAEIIICDDPCIAWPYGDEGQVAMVYDTGEGLDIDLGGGRRASRAGGGELSVQDVDGDGRPDLVSSMGIGQLGVLRSTGDGVAGGTWGHTEDNWQGAAVFGDASGDGHKDLLMRREGFLVRPRLP